MPQKFTDCTASTEPDHPNPGGVQVSAVDLLHNGLVRRLQAHIAMMASHQKERRGGQLLIEATSEINRLRDALSRIAEVGHCGSGVAPRIAKDTLMENAFKTAKPQPKEASK
jgi:hypothetical protein